MKAFFALVLVGFQFANGGTSNPQSSYHGQCANCINAGFKYDVLKCYGSANNAETTISTLVGCPRTTACNPI